MKFISFIDINIYRELKLSKSQDDDELPYHIQILN